MEWSLSNLKRLGFNPRMAIDVGAFEGEWTAMFKKIFPSCSVLMVEAQLNKELQLKKITTQLEGTSFHMGLLGAKAGEQVLFHVNSTVSSVLEEYKPNDFKIEPRSTETLDDVVANLKYTQLPDFIKLDAQGYELEILKGTSQILPHVQCILCEVSLIEINKGCPLIHEAIKFMHDRDFVAYDICSFIRRPLDRALWQTDLLFIRKSNPLIQSKNWN